MKKKWFIGGGLVLVAAAAIGIGILSMHSSRSISIGEKSGGAGTTGQANTSSTQNGNSGASNASDPTSSIPNEVADFATVTSSTFVFPTNPINTANYDAKILALANLPAPRTVRQVVSTTTVNAAGAIVTVTTTITKVVPPAPTGWPVPISSAPHPLTGALLPYDRIIAYYGNFYSAQMGVLGQYPVPQMLAMLASTTAMWNAADPTTPAVPAIDYIAVTAQGSPGADGKYRLRMPASQIDEAIDLANQVHGIVFLDIQVGLSTVENEVPILEEYLKMPQVELALDPEFDMHNGQRPGTVIGTMDASDINWAANYLAQLVTQYNLPPKILVVHRFTQAMVTHTSAIQPLPQVQIVMDMDGFGSPAKKTTTYVDFVAGEPVQFTGIKLFYHNDATPNIGGHLMNPAEVLKFAPQPSYIQYE